VTVANCGATLATLSVARGDPLSKRVTPHLPSWVVLTLKSTHYPKRLGEQVTHNGEVDGPVNRIERVDFVPEKTTRLHGAEDFVPVSIPRLPGQNPFPITQTAGLVWPRESRPRTQLTDC
jgi:hypothetical protein